jgi:hypothetical protein
MGLAAELKERFAQFAKQKKPISGMRPVGEEPELKEADDMPSEQEGDGKIYDFACRLGDILGVPEDKLGDVAQVLSDFHDHIKNGGNSEEE